jgi:hypothetical protein
MEYKYRAENEKKANRGHVGKPRFACKEQSDRNDFRRRDQERRELLHGLWNERERLERNYKSIPIRDLPHRCEEKHCWDNDAHKCRKAMKSHAAITPCKQHPTYNALGK